jgi:putative endonuclease
VWPFGRRLSGDEGERLARRRLRRTGYKILSHNYRCPSGEVDIIALAPNREDAKTLVFVEVKTRATDRYVDPASAVDSAKREHVLAAARYYLANHPADDYAARFDVITVVLATGQEPKINHIVDAFSA